MEDDFPDQENILEKVMVPNFSFAPEQLSFCHQHVWYKYDGDLFFRFMAMRTALEELWHDNDFKASSTSCRLHTLRTGHREVYVMIKPSREVYVVAAIADTLSVLVKTNPVAQRKFSEDLDKPIKLIDWYRKRAREKGVLEVDRALRSVIKLILNLPNNPGVWVVPDTEQKLLAVCVTWKGRPNRDVLTICVSAPTAHIF